MLELDFAFSKQTVLPEVLVTVTSDPLTLKKKSILFKRYS